MIKRLLSIGLLTAATAATSTVATAGDFDHDRPNASNYDYYRHSSRGYDYERVRPRPSPVYGGYVTARPWAPHNGGRDAADPAYASPDSQSYFNPSVGGKTGTYADDGVSGE